MSIRPEQYPQSGPSSEGGFLGFKPLQSNTTYTPNQFFDVCLPHGSRGCIRLVGYMIRRTLGWCDADGNPQESQIQISWNDLIKKAKISRGALGPALKEALERRFIICSRKGQRDTKGVTGNQALYELNWDEDTSHYEKDPDQFRGFYAHGQGGNRTDIPNQYFDVVVPQEPLAVTKLVGVIMRFSIGFQNKTGARRQQVALAYSQICKRVNISSRTTVSNALKTALAKNYVHQIVKGGISISRDTQITSVYGVKWTDADSFLAEAGSENGPENPDVPRAPVQKLNQGNSVSSSKNGPADRFENWPDADSENGLEPVQESDQNTSSESGPIKTKILKETLLNENLKQQASEPVAAKNLKSIRVLCSAGFEEKQAQEIAALPHVSLAAIERQIQWLEARNPKKNKLGLLRKAIEGDWEQPEHLAEDASKKTPARRFADAFYLKLSGPREVWEEPSRNDLRLGEAFFGALETEDDPELVGERFGKFCESNKMDFISLTASLRSEGKAFLKSEQQRKAAQDREQKKRDQAQRELDLVAKEKAWHKHLWKCEAELKNTRPDDYQAFLDSRTAVRSKIEEENKDSETFAKMLLSMHDSEEARISELQEFFSTEIPDLDNFGHL